MNTQETCRKVTEAAEAALPTMQWKQDEGQMMPGARFYIGTDTRDIDDSAKVMLVLSTFSIEEQGFPPGSRGVDGVIRSESVIMRMPRELAEKARPFAEKEEKP